MNRKAITILLILVLTLTVSCGKEPAASASISAETKEETLVNVDDNVVSVASEQETEASVSKEEPVLEPETNDTQETAQPDDDSENIVETLTAVTDLHHDGSDNLKYFETNLVEQPYFVGKESSSFLAGVSYDSVVYLGVPKLLEEGYSYTSSDESIAVINGREFQPKTQGLTTLTKYDSDGNAVSEEIIAVTTFNDGKDVLKASSMKEYNGSWYEIFDARAAKLMINTITDMVDFLTARWMVYDGAKEPLLTGTDGYNSGDWQWTAPGYEIYDYNGGVCVQVCQLADYMLADNFEEWGNILVFGNQGHIFNWFYEDGYYYIMDFTEVISDNQWGGYSYRERRNYTKSIKKFTSVDEVKKYITSEKVDTTQNYLVVMYSNLGHDYMPCWADGGMHDSRAVFDGGYTEYAFEDEVFDSLEILYIDESLDIHVVSCQTEDLPSTVRMQRTGCYGTGVKYYFDYK